MIKFINYDYRKFKYYETIFKRTNNFISFIIYVKQCANVYLVHVKD